MKQPSDATDALPRNGTVTAASYALPGGSSWTTDKGAIVTASICTLPVLPHKLRFKLCQEHQSLHESP